MSIASPSTRFNAEDLLHLPDNAGMELVDGQIVEKIVSSQSSLTELQIAALLKAFADSKRTAVVFPATMGYQCFQAIEEDPNRIRKPDVSVIKMDRYKAPANKNPGYMTIVPDLAVDVLSINDVLSDVTEKILEYRRAGFPLLWIVDPLGLTVTVYPNPGKPFIRSEDDELTAERALPGFVCRVSDLFPPL
jgi:Uma2 family endonuclease